MSRRYGWLLLILLAGALLRIALLTEVPPGLTHDEADHGLDAWGVINGVRPLYFTVGYGREPLYDYSTAGLMAFLGPSFMAGRLTGAFFSILLIAGTYSWVSRAFNRRTALYTAAGLAVSFWAVMTGRQALRSITMPAIFALAAIFYWRAIGVGGEKVEPPRSLVSQWFSPGSTPNFLAAGLLLGVTFYTYIPARIMWLLFPLMLPFLALVDRSWFSRIWRGTLMMLLAAGLIALPLIIFLVTNPGVEIRLDQLSQPLSAAGQGDFDPLIENIVSGLGVINFDGDGQWRYNIPGRPLLAPIMSVLFIIGVVVAGWRIYADASKRSTRIIAASAFFALSWLIIGLAPVLITGKEFSTPRAVAIQPVLYLFPALALGLLSKIKWPVNWISTALVVLLFTAIFGQTMRQYFYVWGKEPEVRVQYEASLVTTLDYLDGLDQRAVAVSTTTPEKFHSPAVALLRTGNDNSTLRWFNGLHSILVPAGPKSQVIFSGFAPLNPNLEAYFPETSPAQIPTLPTDADRPLLIFTVDPANLQRQWQSQFSKSTGSSILEKETVQFGETAFFLGYDLQTPEVSPGGEVRLVTLWELNQPLDGAVLFTQLLGHDGLPIAQEDRLDAPGLYWGNGDFLIQLHQFQLPEDIEPGDYSLIIGMYTTPSLERLPMLIDGVPDGDHLELPPLKVRE